jgi:ATP-binding cassette subfamily F protein uup
LVSVLSGGERNRLLLAKLFAQPANLLVLDEPTNDLDVETLELLEGILGEYQGTVLLVSHDREFIDNVVTGTLVLDGSGIVRAYAGGYDDYLRQSAGQEIGTKEASKKSEFRPVREKPAQPKKLTYKERLELETLPQKIETLENEQETLFGMLSDPALYQNDPEKIRDIKTRSEALAEELASLYSRWETLEEIHAQ